MASRLLSALDARIAKTRDPLQNTCLRAERAALLARQGHLEEARAELAIIHAHYDGRPNAVVSAWVSLAEGLVIYFSNLGGAARDKIKRSLALSEAIRAESIQALSAAWLAQMDFSSLDFEPMLRHLPLALRVAGTSQHSALSRACLVVAEAYHWAERLDLALPWYSRARQHASAEGDESTLSALMHNMACLRAAEARRLSVSGVFELNQARQAQLGADSTNHFDELIGMAALGSLVPILRAQVLVLHGRFVEALKLLEANIEDSMKEGLDRMLCVMLADVAWCRLKTGDVTGAQRDAQTALSSIAAATHVDDRAMTHSRLAQICVATNEPDVAREHTMRASAAWQIHLLQQSHLVPALARALEGL